MWREGGREDEKERRTEGEGKKRKKREVKDRTELL
jgi:hypothetical protein